MSRSELQKLETLEDYVKAVHEYLLTECSCKTLYIGVAQDDERFSRSVEDDEGSFCWMCDVKVRLVEKSLCSGCLKARYCSLGCLRADWGLHGEWCQRRKEGREGRRERKLEMMRERARRDIEEDTFVD